MVYPICPECGAEMVDENEGYYRLRFGEPSFVCPMCSKSKGDKMKLKITALLMWKKDPEARSLITDGQYKQVEFTVGDEIIEHISKKYAMYPKLKEMELIDLYFSTGGLPAEIKLNVMGIPDMVRVIAFEYVEEGDEDE